MSTADTNGGELQFLDNNLPSFVAKAASECKVDVNPHYFIVNDPNTDIAKTYHGLTLNNFKQTLAGYLKSKNASVALVEPPGPINEVGGSNQTDGQASNLAYAVTDATRYFDWRPNSRKVILMIGDEGWYIGQYNDPPVNTTDGPLKGQPIDATAPHQAINQAISTASQANVTVYTWRTDPGHETFDTSITTAQYQKVASGTGGTFYETKKREPGPDIVAFIHGVVCTAPNNNPNGGGPLLGGNRPLPGNGPNGGNGPSGGGDGGGTLCDQLPGIVKTLCSMTTLLHKVVDACYPPSSWPTSPYPDGCGDSGKKGGKGGCGCGGTDPASGTLSGPGPVISNPAGSAPGGGSAVPNAGSGT
jgi:hypothetical protein